MTGKLLVVDNSLNVPAYRPVGHWEALAREKLIVHRPEQETSVDLAGVSHVFVTGSEASINEDAEWIERQAALLRRIVALGIPTLASCFGHQLLARALWGKTFVRRSPTPEFGWVNVTINEVGLKDDLLSGCTASFDCYSAHFDEIAPLPPGFVCLASSLRCPNAIVRVGELPVWGIQHHPEIDIPTGTALLHALAEMMPERVSIIEEAAQLEPRDSGSAALIVKNFLTVAP